MKLLPEANISGRIVLKVKVFFDNCFHVDFIELNSPASGIDIWNLAKSNDLIIVTNDEDFLNLKKYP